MASDAYREAGVDIAKGEALVDRIKPLAAATHRAGVLGQLGGFGGLFALQDYDDPVLVSGTDGVGTKLLLAQQLGIHDTIGVDLVAMCVNDIACTGAEPLFFLDYFATGALDLDTGEAVVRGIARGCELAGCALLGGETAEMPGMYAPGHYDLAGFAVGVAERADLLTGDDIAPGDCLVGVPSSGVHSNGYSLVRKLLADSGRYDLASSELLGTPLGEALLAPTRIYAQELLAARRQAPYKGVAHITGGGLPGNVPRMLPDGLGARLDRASWSMPAVFSLLQEAGALSDDDLLHTFNCGLGLVIATAPAHATRLAEILGGAVVGEVVEDPAGEAVVA